mgnify:FL=1
MYIVYNICMYDANAMLLISAPTQPVLPTQPVTEPTPPTEEPVFDTTCTVNTPIANCQCAGTGQGSCPYDNSMCDADTNNCACASGFTESGNRCNEGMDYK